MKSFQQFSLLSLSIAMALLGLSMPAKAHPGTDSFEKIWSIAMIAGEVRVTCLLHTLGIIEQRRMQYMFNKQREAWLRDFESKYSPKIMDAMVLNTLIKTIDVRRNASSKYPADCLSAWKQVSNQ